MLINLINHFLKIMSKNNIEKIQNYRKKHHLRTLITIVSLFAVLFSLENSGFHIISGDNALAIDAPSLSNGGSYQINSDLYLYLYWSTVPDAASYIVFRCPTSNAETANCTTLNPLNNDSIDDGPFAPLTTYYYRVAGVDPNNNSIGPLSNEVAATTLAVINNALSSSFNTITLSGTIKTANAGATIVEVGFRYWPSLTIPINYTTTTAQVGNSGVPEFTFTGALTNLTPSTEYRYQAYALDDQGIYYYGPTPTLLHDVYFRTGAAPLSVTNQEATDITTSSVTLNGTINSLGDSGVREVGFVYGATTAYGTTSTISVPARGYAVGDLSKLLENLSSGRIYHYNFYASTPDDPKRGVIGVSTYGTDRIFSTISVPTAESPDTVITASNTVTTTIAAPSSVSAPKLDFTSLVSGNAVTLPGAMTATIETSLGSLQFSIPNAVTITAGGAWDGVLNLPTIKANNSVTVVPSAGKEAAVSAVLEVGDDDNILILDRAARLLIPGQAGKNAGYYRGSSFSAITTDCTADDQTIVDAQLGNGAECKIDVGNDMVIWTKHFTSFLSYTQSDIPRASGCYDCIAPEKLSLLINKGADITNTTTVLLNLSATDNLDSADQLSMMISNDTNFKDGVWKEYTATTTWELLPNAGKKEVYAKFKDRWSNTSQTISTSINLIFPIVNNTNNVVAVIEDLLKNQIVEPLSKTDTMLLADNITDQNSKIIINQITDFAYQPGEKINFTYNFTNDSKKTLYTKVTRQLINKETGKIVKNSLSFSYIKPNKSFKRNISELLKENLTSGNYEMTITVYDLINKKVIDTNSIKIFIEKKQNKFLLGGQNISDGITMDKNFLTEQTGKKLPYNLTYKFNYKNLENKAVTLTVQRELLDNNGKPVDQGTTFKVKVPAASTLKRTFIRPFPKLLPAGEYSLRVRVYDATKKLLKEDQVNVDIVLR